MCKSQSITYTCGHTINFCLSSCAASFNFQTRKGEKLKAKCCASPDIVFWSRQACGVCEREKAQLDVNAELAGIEAKFPEMGWEIPEEVVAARAHADQELWDRWRGLPDSKFKFKKLPKPREVKVALSRRSKGSLLRTEIKSEEIVDRDRGWDEEGWGAGTSLSEEIAKVEAQRAADGIPPLAPTFSVFADDDWSDITELGACEEDTFDNQEEELPEIVAAKKAPMSRLAQEYLPKGAFIAAAPAVQDKERMGTSRRDIVPPHRNYEQKIRAMAQNALQDTTYGSGKHLADEGVRPRRCRVVPLI